MAVPEAPKLAGVVVPATFMDGCAAGVTDEVAVTGLRMPKAGVPLTVTLSVKATAAEMSAAVTVVEPLHVVLAPVARVVARQVIPVARVAVAERAEIATLPVLATA